MIPPLELERVLTEDGWLRRIARRLVGERDADDLAQDAWVAALARGRRGREARPWMLGVMHNLRRQRARRAADESARVREGAERRLAPSTDEVVLELTQRQRVTAGLLALEEPYRTALFLRYVHDATLEQIARQTGVAVSTAHGRVRRGLELLHARLDPTGADDGRSWAALLLPAAGPPRLAATLGGIAMGTAAKVAVSLAALGGALIIVWSRVEHRAALVEQAAEPREERAAEEPSAPALLAQPAASGEARAALPRAAETPPAERTPAAPAPMLHGRVLDVDGAPVGGVPVGYGKHGARGEAEATSDAGGAFALPARASGGERLVCLAPDLTTLVHGAESGGERIVVVAPRADLAGTVVDPAGAPIAGASVAFRLRQSLFRDLGVPRPFTAESTGERSTTTGLDGRFAFEGAAGGPHLALQASAPGYADQEVDLPRGGDPGLVIALQPLDGDVLIRGLVLDALGRPAAGASVSSGVEIATTGPDGAFELRWRKEGTGQYVQGEDQVWRPEADSSMLMAAKPGHGAVRVSVADLDLAAEVVLRLASAPRQISGRVVDPEGKPRAGVLVWETTAHLFGSEILTSGSGRAMVRRTLEEMTRGAEPQGALTDAEGRFALGGLWEGTYDLAAFDPRTCAQAGGFSAQAGASGIVLVLADEPGMARVAGRVVTAAGTPITGVQVLPKRSLLENANAQPPLRDDGAGPETQTDAEGRFEFPLLATRGTSLELQHDLFFIRWVALDGREDLEHLELVQPVLCELQVDLGSDPGLADQLQVLGADGQAIELVESFGVFMAFGQVAELKDGKSNVLRVPETARTLVLSKGGAEVLRRSLQLDPGQRTNLHL
jgi:RNA polymerase sigma-70 factor (ECF subfamily)